MSALLFLRSLLHGPDSRNAAHEERRSITRSLERSRTPIALPWDVTPGERTIEIGTLPDGRVVELPLSALRSHALSLGPTGGGKSAADSHRAVQALTAGTTSAVLWANSKPDLVAYTRAGLAHHLTGLHPKEARTWLDRIVVLAPTSEKYFVPLQLLWLPEGADPELLALDVVSSFGSLTDAAVGVCQEDLLADAVALLVELRLPITMAAQVLRNPATTVCLARHTQNPERFLAFAEKTRVQAKSDRFSGLVSRLNRITRLRHLRLMLGGADRCVDWGGLLGSNKIIFVDLSVPAHGLEAAASFLGRFLWSRFARAALSRRIGSACLPVFIDEFQELLGVGPGVGTDLERLLRLARARGIFLHLATQTLTGLQKFSGSLPDVLNTNVGLTVAFRGADPPEAALPITGSVPRSPGLPWEERRGTFFLSKAEEITQVRNRLAMLPNRHCLVRDASTGKPAFFMRTADAKLEPPADCSAEILDGLEGGTLSLSESDLERGVEGYERRLTELTGGSALPGVSDGDLGEVSTKVDSPGEGLAAPPSVVPLRRKRQGALGIG
jgi:hypothetical protein